MKKIYLGKSGIQGDGVFAGENIKKGEFVLFMRGKRIFRVYDNIKDYDLCADWVGLKKNLWINPDFPVARMNHSCNPNLGMRGSVTFKAIKNIKKDEELTFDYSICEEEMDWKLKCHCGSKHCRKIIRSIQFLPKEVFENYLPYVPTYFQLVYNKNK